MPETQVSRTPQVLKSPVAKPDSSKAGENVQLKRSLADLPYERQVQFLRPPLPTATSLSAVQLETDTVQMVEGAGGASTVPRSLEEVRAFMLVTYPVLKDKYANATKIETPELQSHIQQLEALVASGKHDESTKAQSDAILNSAIAICQQKYPVETEELRGIYETMGKVHVPNWQAQLAEEGVPKEQRAELAVMQRNAYKQLVREYQTERTSVRVMELRNLIHYNNEIGPSLQQLMDEIKLKHPELPDDAILDRVIGKAGKSSEMINKTARGEK